MDVSFVLDLKEKTLLISLLRKLDVFSSIFYGTLRLSDYIVLNNILEKIWEEVVIT
jgi:hypothetical protein